MVRPMVHSEKHFIQFPQFAIAANTIGQRLVVDAVQVLNKDATSEVEEGSAVKAVYFEFWLVNSDATIDFAVATIEKLPANAPAMTLTNANNLQAYPNKKNIFWTFEGILPGDTANPIPIIRMWLKIPKSKQRMGLADKIAINFAAGASNVTICGFALYKEYK